MAYIDSLKQEMHTKKELLEFMKREPTPNEILYMSGVSVYETHKTAKKIDKQSNHNWLDLPDNNFDPRLGFNVINQGRI